MAGTMRTCGGWLTVSKDNKPKNETPEPSWPMKQSDEPSRGPSEPDQKNKSKPDLEKWQETKTH
jgi:hypothetical protein